jgi:MinD superfamily P-loop ATPase
MAIPVITQTKNQLEKSSAQLALLDSPPGTSCSMVESTKDADYVLMVTEPTPFGLNDLKLAVETTRTLKRNFGVIINREMDGFAPLDDYLKSENIEIIARIPFSPEIASSLAGGDTIVDNSLGMDDLFKNIGEQLLKKVNYGS